MGISVPVVALEKQQELPMCKGIHTSGLVVLNISYITSTQIYLYILNTHIHTSIVVYGGKFEEGLEDCQAIQQD